VGVIVDTDDSKFKALALELKLGPMFTMAAFEFATSAITSAIRDDLIFVVFILFFPLLLFRLLLFRLPL
jgi:hypothetical protein